MFTGRQFEEETGLYFYRARYYDPNKDRFLQRDPLEYSNSMSLYSYVEDRPTYSTDPSGLRTFVRLEGDRRNCTIQVTTYINFRGEAATPDNIRRIKSDIETRWNGFQYWGARASQPCKVNFNVVSVPTSWLDTPFIGGFLSGSVDRIELLNGGPDDDRASNVNPGRTVPYDENHVGTWLAQNRIARNLRRNPDNFVWTPAHEYGHLIGLPDMYIGGVPEGWGGNIMATDMGKADNRNIYRFLDSVEKKQGNFTIPCPELCPRPAVPEGYAEMVRRYQESVREGREAERKRIRREAGLGD